mmetsp:Transcript_18278/g.39513  ORF Transcript_18278/g.39513 Transcript_18278/m.39513 type:complete len:84 (+) Transcript_18278:187-438(+)
MPTLYEARCLNCGNHGHYREECPRVECRKCHSLGHTGSNCHVKLPPVKFDNSLITDKQPLKSVEEYELDSTVEEDHLEKYYAS